MSDLLVYILFVLILLVAVALAIILRLSELSKQGIWETLREYWRTFFGEISDKPPDK